MTIFLKGEVLEKGSSSTSKKIPKVKLKNMEIFYDFASYGGLLAPDPGVLKRPDPVLIQQHWFVQHNAHFLIVKLYN